MTSQPETITSCCRRLRHTQFQHNFATAPYGLRVSSEGKKSFFVMGRVRGRALQFTIGSYGTFTEHLARLKAQSILQGMRDGIDPRESSGRTQR